MAKMMRLVLAVAPDQLADVLESLSELSVKAEVSSMGNVDAPANDAVTVRPRAAVMAIRRVPAPIMDDGEDDDAGTVELPVARTSPVPQRAATTRTGRRMLYTPAGTKRQITAALEQLRGHNTLRAFVYRDLAKHPGSLNVEVRKRAEKAGHNPESVDNVVWRLVNDNLVAKQAAE